MGGSRPCSDPSCDHTSHRTPKAKSAFVAKREAKSAWIAAKKQAKDVRANKCESHLEPIFGAAKRLSIAVYDVESKAEHSQSRGFTRPFLLSFLVGDDYHVFRNHPSVQNVPWEKRHLDRGGCVDQFMRFILGERDCAVCEPLWEAGRLIAEAGTLEDEDGTHGDVVPATADLCPDCQVARQRFQSSSTSVYAHNGGRFDHLFILGWLKLHKDRYSVELTPAQSKILKLTIKLRGHNQERWVFLDSVGVLPMSLEKVGKTFNATAKKMEMDLDAHEDDPRWDPYCKQDCLVLKLGLERLHDLVESIGGEVGITMASTSMRTWRRAFLKGALDRGMHFPSCPGTRAMTLEDEDRGLVEYLPGHVECEGCAHAFVRLAYYGGRTELFREIGRGLRYFDINSSYPRSMLEMMPVGKPREVEAGTSLAALARLRKKGIGFIECTVEIPESCEIPPLPFRKDGKLVFPAGRFSGVWDYDELMLLYDPLVKGRIVRVGRSLWYDQAPVFKDYIEQLWSFRNKSSPDYNEGLSEVAKLLMNALYGKCAQRPDRTQIVMPADGEWPDGYPSNGNPETAPYWICDTYSDAAYIMPQLSAHVTTLSRIRLWKGMASVITPRWDPSQMKYTRGHVWYCDTDSILCDVEVDDQGTALGQWKDEYPGLLLDGHFVLPKHYYLKKHKPDCYDRACSGCAGIVLRMKGLKGDKRTLESFETMLPTNKGGKGGKVYFPRLTQHKTMLNEGLFSPVEKTTHKSIRSAYDKRRLQPDGSSLPLLVYEEAA